jgi:hypothetical protein
MTDEGEYVLEWRKLSEELMDNLDNQRKAARIRKRLDILWAKIIREQGKI